MRLILLLSIVANSLSTHGQDAVDFVVLRLIRQGVEGKQLPPELENMKDSINFPNNMVVVQKTKENGLNSGAYVQYGDIHYAIWTAEELFVRDPYWITPGTIHRNGNKISFDFTTTYLSTKPATCYKGLIKGKLIKGGWAISKCSYRPIPCRFDLNKFPEE